MKSKHSICPRCGSKLVHYSHKLSVPLVDALYKLHAHGPGKVSDLDITHSQYNNFHKLRYWMLIKEVKNCQYEITPLGEMFLKGEINIPERAVTYLGKVVKLIGRLVEITDISPRFQVRADYRREAV